MNVQIDANEIPQVRIDVMARSVLAAVKAYFEDPQVQAEFELWLKEREANANI